MSDLNTTTPKLHPGNQSSLRRGSVVGRYIVLELIGSGGIGVVYSAYDPKLDRKIAIKLLRSGRPPTVDDDLQHRMAREAKAMARLSHRNVVAVYDVGTLGGNVFIAMEYVQGCTLRAWLQKKREPSEILRVFLGAGWGLAAANAAGLIHRDFKPDNVLVGDDGRVQVTDFGLARALMTFTTQSVAEWAPDSRLGLTDALTDGPVGTPGYMAPEQFDGKSVDSRADQFSFCVALYEALYRQRPFAGATLPELMENLRSGKVREPPKDAHVPQRLRRILLKGLSPQPTNRYASMELLLKALSKNPRVYWRRAGVALAGLALLAAVGWTYQSTRSHQRQLCRSGSQQLEAVWDSQVKQNIQHAFINTGQSYARTTWNTVENLLNGYARDWTSVYANACEATHLRKQQPEVVYGLQLVCLEQRLQQVKALTQLFTQADKSVLQNAVNAVAALPSVKPCSDVKAVSSSIVTPTDPGLRTKVEQLRTKLAQADALYNAGQYTASAELAQTMATKAAELSYRSLQAEALYYWGRAELKLEHSAVARDTLMRAATAAEAVSGKDELKARSLLLLAFRSSGQGRPEEALGFADQAAAVSERLGHPPDLELTLHKIVGVLYAQQKKGEVALDEFQKALEFAESLHRTDNVEIGYILNYLGTAHEHLGHYQQAAFYSERAIQVLEKILGNQHPDLAIPIDNLANSYYRLGSFDHAVELHQRGLAIRRESFGERSRSVAQTLSNLATLYSDWGKPKEAKENFERSITAYEASMGPEFHELMAPLDGLGVLLMRTGQPAKGLRMLLRALALNEKAWGPDHQDNAIILTDIGEALMMQHEARLAIHPLERALRIREDGRANPPSELASTRFALSRALWEAGGDRERARHLALLAWDGMLSAEQKPPAFAELQTWLTRRGWRSFQTVHR